jgi:predicted nucleic acid-binding protein
VCLIVDANRAGVVFRVPPTADFKPLWRWLLGKKGRLVYGGQLAAELSSVGPAVRFLKEWRRTGRAVLANPGDVAAEVSEVSNHCRSDDAHVVALARVTGARILCTEDSDLMTDFRNRRLVPPRGGKIYRRARHAALFNPPACGHCRGCHGPMKGS